MIEELKSEIEKTFGRKISDRGDCEELANDLYAKTGAVLSYNTLRRMYGLAEFRKPRENTLDQLSVYCGFKSFKDFSQRYAEVDIWPTWESLYVAISHQSSDKFIELLRYRKRRGIHFSLSFTIVARELISRKDLNGLQILFREPDFQFVNLPYDEVAQIGVLMGLHFRTFHDHDIEKSLLQEPNFRDLVFKIFVDYGRLNGKYGLWVQHLAGLDNLDSETRIFVNCIEAWRQVLAKEPILDIMMDEVPELSLDQHPILFGRIFGLKYLTTAKKRKKQQLLNQMQARLISQPQFITELLYEPAVQALVTQNEELYQFVDQHEHLVNDIKFWYHYSQVAIHKVFQVATAIQLKQYHKALTILKLIPFGHIRHGYREFIELYVAFFHWKISEALQNKDVQKLKQEFEHFRNEIDYPLFTDSYFENYFKD